MLKTQKSEVCGGTREPSVYKDSAERIPSMDHQYGSHYGNTAHMWRGAIFKGEFF